MKEKMDSRKTGTYCNCSMFQAFQRSVRGTEKKAQEEIEIKRKKTRRERRGESGEGKRGGFI